MRQIFLQLLQRLWLSLKREEVYLTEHESVMEAVEGIAGGCRYYNHERPQRVLGDHPPAGVYISRVADKRNELVVSR
jgi:transposase InsO family protein